MSTDHVPSYRKVQMAHVYRCTELAVCIEFVILHVQAKAHEEAMNGLIKAGYIKTCTDGGSNTTLLS